MHHLLRTLLLALLLTVTLRLSPTLTNKSSHRYYTSTTQYRSELHSRDSLSITCTPTFSNGQAICVAVIGWVGDGWDAAVARERKLGSFRLYYVEAEWVKEWVLLAVRWGIVLDLVGGLQFWG